MIRFWHIDNLYSMYIVLLIYAQNLHYKHIVKINRAHHFGHILLSDIKNDFILKFSLKKWRKFYHIRHLTFKFTIDVTITCRVTFCNSKLLCWPPHPLLDSSSLLSPSFVKKKKTVWSNHLLKSDMDHKSSFEVIIFKTSCL